MSSFLVSSGKRWVRGFSPMARHVYKYLKPAHPTAIYMHHSTTDKMVKYNGCCRDQHCCCGIHTKSVSTALHSDMV